MKEAVLTSALFCCNLPSGGYPKATLLKRSVEGVGGADEAQVGEGLGEVAEVLAFGTEFFGVEADVICVAEHFFEDETALLDIAGAGEAFSIPEGAHAEGAFLAGQAVGRGVADAVAVDE